MEHWRRAPWVFAVLLSPACAWLLAFFLIPLSLVWIESFGAQVDLVTVDAAWTPDNYLRAFEPLYLKIIGKSMLVAGATTLICLAIGLPLAFGVSFAPGRWKPLLLLLVVLPFWTNLLVRTYALMAVLRTKGLINTTLGWVWEQGDGLLALVGLSELNLIGERFTPLPLMLNSTGVLIGLVYVYLPFMALPLYAALERLDRAYLEASLDLGASQTRTFFSVVAPLAMPGVVSGVILVFIPALGAFLTPALLGGPADVMIGNVIERQFKSANNWPFGAALSFVLMYAAFGALALRSLISRRRGTDA